MVVPEIVASVKGWSVGIGSLPYSGGGAGLGEGGGAGVGGMETSCPAETVTCSPVGKVTVNAPSSTRISTLPSGWIAMTMVVPRTAATVVLAFMVACEPLTKRAHKLP
jgi:hypothetical protein